MRPGRGARSRKPSHPISLRTVSNFSAGKWWIELPEQSPARVRARLLARRLISDGGTPPGGTGAPTCRHWGSGAAGSAQAGGCPAPGRAPRLLSRLLLQETPQVARSLQIFSESGFLPVWFTDAISPGRQEGAAGAGEGLGTGLPWSEGLSRAMGTRGQVGQGTLTHRLSPPCKGGISSC